MAKIADRLRLLREEHDLSQSEFAAKMGVNRMTINNYETGKRTPDVEFALRAADYFRVSVEFISGRTEFRHREDMEISFAKVEELMDVVSSMPQVEFQQMILDLTRLLEQAREYDCSTAVLVGLDSLIETFTLLVSKYARVKSTVVNEVIELRERGLPSDMIEAICANKAAIMSDHVLIAADTLFGTLKTCGNMLRKELKRVSVEV